MTPRQPLYTIDRTGYPVIVPVTPVRKRYQRHSKVTEYLLPNGEKTTIHPDFLLSSPDDDYAQYVLMQAISTYHRKQAAT